MAFSGFRAVGDDGARDRRGDRRARPPCGTTDITLRAHMAQPRKANDDGHRADGDGVVAGTRALTARSVAASTLLGMTPPRLSSQLLVRSGELFGITEGTTRVALSRISHSPDQRRRAGACRRLAIWRSCRANRWPASW
jgi:hypothetical protein